MPVLRSFPRVQRNFGSRDGHDARDRSGSSRLSCVRTGVQRRMTTRLMIFCAAFAADARRHEHR